MDNLLLTLVALLLILRRQLQPRAVKEEQPYLIMGVLAVIGVAETAGFVKTHAVAVSGWSLLALSLVVAIGFGAARGALVHVWRQEGRLMRQGNAVTVVLWVVAVAAHLGFDVVIGRVDEPADGLGIASLLLYLAVSLAAQRLLTLRRAAALA